MVCSTSPAAPGGQSAADGWSVGGRRVVGQRLDDLPGPALVVTGEQRGGLGAGVQALTGKTQRPHLREALAERHPPWAPADHRGEVRILRRPSVSLPVGELRKRPGIPGVVGAPDAGPGPLASTARPHAAGGRVADDVVDRPAGAIRPAHRPAGAVGAAIKHEGAFGRADQHAGSGVSHAGLLLGRRPGAGCHWTGVVPVSEGGAARASDEAPRQHRSTEVHRL